MNWLVLSLAMLSRGQSGDFPAPLHQWRLTADHVREQQAHPSAGAVVGNLVGPRKFSPDRPHALMFDGNSKAKHGLHLADLREGGDLPAKNLTVEAWVRVDQVAEWGGLLGAFQDNGSFEKGWLLGFHQSQFCFAVASTGTKRLTYLKAKSHFQVGYWYHVVGTYDGKTQRVFVNGKLQGQATEQSGPLAYPPKAFYTLGAYRDDDEHFTLAGQVEEVTLFAASLTPEQVQRRFLARKSVFPDMDARPPVVSDWPTFLRDNLRTGLTPEALKLPLPLVWTHRTRLPPEPSWPEEAKHDYWHNKYNMEERVTYDRAFHLVSVGDHIYFGSSSEDAVFCLDAATGAKRWSFVTEGPVRLAPTVVDDRLLFGSDDGHVYCLNARDGTLVWKRLLAPSPRRIPGNNRVISAWPVRTDVLVEGDRAHVCAGVFPSQGVYQYVLDVKESAILSKKTIAVTAQGYQQRMFGKLMIGTGRNPAGAFVGDLKSAGRDVEREASTLTREYPFAFIGAAGMRIAGGDGKIAAFDSETGKKLWSADVDGRVHSLAAVRGRLLASTDRGVIYCFGADGRPATSVAPRVGAPTRPEVRGSSGVVADALKSLGAKRRGYALVLGATSHAVLEDLVRHTDLQIIVRDPDEAACRELRDHVHRMNRIDRVRTHHGNLDDLPYTDHLFNVVLGDGRPLGPRARAEALRVLRPHGGVAVLGTEATERHIAGPLPGEGEWTHQYGDAGNTACSRDTRLQGELQLQWFGKPGPRDMIDRHHRTAAPLSKQGRLFVPGEDRVIAVDAYNGTILWEKPFPESRRVVVFRDCSYLALDESALYVASTNQCQAVDPETGTTRRSFLVPEALREHDWGYVARSGGVLVGSAVKRGSSRRLQSAIVDRTETYYDYVPLVGSDALFAFDPATGARRWTYTAKGLIPNPAIAASDDTLYFLESKNPTTLEGKLSRARMSDLAQGGMDVVALDLATGKPRWRQRVDLSKLDHIAYVTYASDRLVISGSRNSTRDKKTGKVWYDLLVLDAKEGKELWAGTQNQEVAIGGDHGEQDQHPVIVEGKLYQEPYAYDLETGSRLEFRWPWAGRRRTGCGTLTASAGQFFFRDQTTSMFDLSSGTASKVTTETRPGCWVNLLPVGGLLLAPEASSGCSCNFSVQTSLALIPVRQK